MIESVMAANLNPRQQKRLYVGGLPAGVTEAEIVDFICESYDKLGANKEAGRVCISANINEEKHYCFVEFRNPEETTEGMALDRSVFKGQELQVRRPKDFNTPGGGQLMKAGDFSSPNKIYVGGIPSHLNDEQIKDLLQAFGDLRSFKLLKDQITGESKVFYRLT